LLLEIEEMSKQDKAQSLMPAENQSKAAT